jgi:hypothetical protein
VKNGAHQQTKERHGEFFMPKRSKLLCLCELFAIQFSDSRERFLSYKDNIFAFVSSSLTKFTNSR